jgi:hypothetical protein
MKKYKLLKDLPEAKAGTILTPGDLKDVYEYPCSSGAKSWYANALVENTPEWFQEIKEPKWTDDDMLRFANYVSLFGGNTYSRLEDWKRQNNHRKEETYV